MKLHRSLMQLKTPYRDIRVKVKKPFPRTKEKDLFFVDVSGWFPYFEVPSSLFSWAVES